ncbi:hypothetical protein AGMMS49928_29840 [Spirochaetia bacterium]|nr:hypothetical protein AGMMS49928_29840 [Spirochaetia bacterium]
MAFDNYSKDNGYEKSLETINEWLNNKNENIRRAVTEGLRSWIKRPYFDDNPQEAIKILAKYKTDESEYVRKSVGNALKDISKKYPELIKELCIIFFIHHNFTPCFTILYCFIFYVNIFL